MDRGVGAVTQALHDTDLISRAKSDPEAMDRLIRGLDRWIWSVVWRSTNRESIHAWGMEEEDVWQEAAMSVVRAARAWDPRRGTFAAVAHQAARNSVLMLHRRHGGREAPLSLDHRYGDDDGASLIDLLPSEEGFPEGHAETVRLCLSLMRGRRGQVVRVALRHVLSGSTMQRAARELGVTRSYVAHAMTRFRSLVRERMSA